jgi:hypothetical protein
MYRDADGRHDGFGTESIQALSSASNTVSVFASKEPGWVDVMLLNKDLQAAHRTGVNLRRVTAAGSIQRFQYSSEDPSSIARLADLGASSSMSLELPAGSITLLRVPVAR